MNSKGTGQIGSYDHMIKPDGTFAIERRKEPKAETDDGVPKIFAGNSSYSVNFPYYGNIPEANKMPQKKFVAGYGDMKGVSSYKLTFSGEGQQKHHDELRTEKVRVKDYKK